ncbi:hypothetical protein, partial [Pseudomonas sp. FW305-33]|uniref:hypothetical protein n=1 Tax=Pseudomonas sp. FW305-33 TaxID=2751337 RepID=UPI001C449219
RALPGTRPAAGRNAGARFLMASAPAPSLLDPGIHAARWVAEYRARAVTGDVLTADPDPAWVAMFEELAAAAGDDLGLARERVQRHAEDIGT